MQLTISGMELLIEKSWYNKSKILDDGITHIIDTEKKYPYYQVGMGKNYMDIDSKEELLKSVIADLKIVSKELEKHLEKEMSEKEESNSVLEK